MGNRNVSSSNIIPFNNSSPSRIQRPSSASSLRSSSRYRSDRGRSSSSLSNDSYPLSTLNKLNASDNASPLINKLRAKVASRVMGFKNSEPNNSDYNSSTGQQHASGRPGSAVGSHTSVQQESDHHHPGKSDSSVFPKLKSQSSLTNDQLTAHLTEEERNILQKVFQKEDEFLTEVLSKRQVKNSDKSKEGTASSPAQSTPSTSAQLIGHCRTCVKKIHINEKYNYCDTCSEPICEDCSSYSDKTKEKLWMCSFCRRRGTQPAVAALTELGLMIPSSLVTGRRRSTIVSMKDQLQAQRRPSNVETIRSSESGLTLKVDSPLPGATGRSLRHDSLSGRMMPASPVRRYSSVVPKERYSSNEGLDERRSSGESTTMMIDSGSGLPIKRSDYRSRDEMTMTGSKSPRKSFSASDSSLEDYTIDVNESYAVNGQQHHLKRRRSRRSRSVHHRNLLVDEEFESDPNLFISSSGGHTNGASSLGTGDRWDGLSQERKRSIATVNAIGVNNYAAPVIGGYDNPPTTTNSLRHIASDAALYSTPSETLRRKSDSQSSEYSDIRVASPPQESMSPSSPDFSRSPRESADSDMLGLPSIGPLPTQRRSIPSVLVDNAVDNHHLTLKDCFPRRSSTGRALPRIPSEQSRSLLELPQGRTHSTHSLDLPNPDQPRRASAPEGENITIVIDDVDSAGIRGKTAQIERIILHRDENDVNPRTHGFGLVVMGGKMSETDGRLYAYVAYVVPGGPADKMSLKAKDKILEWDRKSLVNCTFEQVCAIIDSSSNAAELLIEPYNRGERRGALIHQRRRLSQGFSQSVSDIYSSPPVSPSHQGMANRRKLPRTPEAVQTTGQGEVLIQTGVDLERNELLISIICAKGINTKKRPCFVRVRIIPEMGFKCCQTELSNGLEWNETVIIQNFPIEQVTDMALEIGIWESLGDSIELLGETVIPMESAIAHNTDWWPLISPQYLYNVARSSSLDTLAVKPIDNHMNCLSDSKSAPSSRRNSGRSDIIDPSAAISALRPAFSGEPSPSRSMSLRMGRDSIEKLSKPDPTILLPTITAQPSPISLTVELPKSPRRKSASAIMSNKINRSFSLKSNPDTIDGIGHTIEATGAVSNYNRVKPTDSDSDSEGITSESDSINTSTISHMDCDLGSSVIIGEIKLGFVMTKGLLEIEVCAARGLPFTHSKTPPDTYVKTYLKEGNRHTNKKKTRVIYGSCDPQYRQTLKYDAALIYGRSLLVMVWQKHKGFEHNTPLGAVDVKVNQLELHKLTINWYKLYALPPSQ